jgi:Cu/Ag efflux protein CusF
MKNAISSLSVALVFATGSAFAGGDHGGGHGHDKSTNTTVAQAAASADMVDGEVRKVDADNKKITVKHGEIKNLQMPGMTMVFQVKDPAMLSNLKVGDKIRFAAEKSSGAIVITQLEAAK